MVEWLKKFWWAIVAVLGAVIGVGWLWRRRNDSEEIRRAVELGKAEGKAEELETLKTAAVTDANAAATERDTVRTELENVRAEIRAAEEKSETQSAEEIARAFNDRAGRR